MVVGDPDALPGDIVTVLADAFDDLCETPRGEGDCTLIRERIDSIIRRVLS